MKVSIHHRGLIQRLMLHSVGDMSAEDRDDVIKKYHADGCLEMKLTVGGVECDLNSFIAWVEDAMKEEQDKLNQQAKGIAIDMVNDAMGEILNKIRDHAEHVIASALQPK